MKEKDTFSAKCRRAYKKSQGLFTNYNMLIKQYSKFVLRGLLQEIKGDLLAIHANQGSSVSLAVQQITFRQLVHFPFYTPPQSDIFNSLH